MVIAPEAEGFLAGRGRIQRSGLSEGEDVRLQPLAQAQFEACGARGLVIPPSNPIKANVSMPVTFRRECG
ncbi:hypothetical protein GCM10010298_76720 [Streptomyces microflavus]|uniref:Uncharacterized protein n=1 Tax=Streptomyces microflavus TaxID=1919 RepID=A0A7J0D3V0_STRMI|nr:hypothetical protein Smic_77050 [Streptomyces microflavus]GGY00331.1 hypothetical protein GCM10010298_76720 [Streptomyces microflavus]